MTWQKSWSDKWAQQRKSWKGWAIIIYHYGEVRFGVNTRRSDKLTSAPAKSWRQQKFKGWLEREGSWEISGKRPLVQRKRVWCYSRETSSVGWQPCEEWRTWGEHGSTKKPSSSSKTSSPRKKAESSKFQSRNWNRTSGKGPSWHKKAWTDSYPTWYPTYSTAWIQSGGWPSKMEGSREYSTAQDQQQPLGQIEYRKSFTRMHQMFYTIFGV